VQLKRLCRREEGVSPVIAVVLLVAITVVLAAFVYVSVSSMVRSTRAPAPMVGLQVVEVSNVDIIIEVVATERNTYTLSKYQVVLLVNDSVDSASGMNPLQNGTAGNLTYYDRYTPGKLTVGDLFIISIVPNTQYELHLIWKENGNPSGSVEWPHR